jgi:rhodanese-related sulfurtransferase
MFGMKPVPTETSLQVRDALEKGEIILIDVREPTEYAAERIHGALLFPLSTFDPKALPDNEGKQILFQCGSGKRSETAFRKAQAAGVAARGHLGGGIGAWKAAGLPTVTVDPETGDLRDRKA